MLSALFSILILSSCSISSEEVSYCDFASPGKYLGTFITNTGSTKVLPYRTVNLPDAETCKYNCRVNDSCYAASFDNIGKCSFYSTSHLDIKSNSDFTFFLWIMCDWGLAVSPQDGRCKGMFIHYYDRAIELAKSFLLLNAIENVPYRSCYGLCLQNPLCGAVNYHIAGSQCDLLGLWPEKYMHYTDKNGTDMYLWTCIPHFVDDLVLPKTPSQPIDLKCTGYWSVNSRNATFKNVSVSGVYFKTQSLSACLSECDAHPQCDSALFNVTHSLCMLPFTERSDPNEGFRNFTFIELKWVCVKNDAKTPQMNEKERKYEDSNLRCVSLVSNVSVFIAKDNCTALPSATNFVSCQNGTTTTSKEWNIVDQCRIKQSFWSLSESVKIEGLTTNKTIRIFNGLTSFWLSYDNDSRLVNVSFMECRRFDGSRRPSIEKGKIISKNQWQAYRPQGAFKPFRSTPLHIVLTASQKPFYSCRTKDACTSLLRELQLVYFAGSGTTPKFSDIPYNFMVDEDGHIYEARGWTYECAAVLDYNKNSLCFAFIGRFQDQPPSVKFLNSLKGLIEFAVSRGHVSKDYILYVHQDVTTVKIHPNYANIIKTWYRYRGFVPKDCAVMTIVTLIINGISILIIVLMNLLLYRWLTSRKHCKKCQFLHEAHFRMVNQKTCDTRSIDNDDLLEDLTINKACLITERKMFFASTVLGNWTRILKCWFLNKHLRTSSSTCVHHLEGYLKTIANPRIIVQLYQALSMAPRDKVAGGIHIIICFVDEQSYLLFQGLTSNRLCICRYFRIEFLSFSVCEFETVQ